jgi:hypothetical protein
MVMFKGVFDVPKTLHMNLCNVIDGTFVNEPDADSFQWNAFVGMKTVF